MSIFRRLHEYPGRTGALTKELLIKGAYLVYNCTVYFLEASR